MIGICAYDSNLIVTQEDGVELLLSLLNIHSKVGVIILTASVFNSHHNQRNN